MSCSNHYIIILGQNNVKKSRKNYKSCKPKFFIIIFYTEVLTRIGSYYVPSCFEIYLLTQLVALSKRDIENVQSFSAFLTQSVRTASLSEQIATRNSRLMVVAASCVFVDDFRNDFNVSFSSFFLYNTHLSQIFTLVSREKLIIITYLYIE